MRREVSRDPEIEAFDCPFCNKAAGSMCITSTGHETTSYHMARRRLSNSKKWRHVPRLKVSETQRLPFEQADAIALHSTIARLYAEYVETCRMANDMPTLADFVVWMLQIKGFEDGRVFERGPGEMERTL